MEQAVLNSAVDLWVKARLEGGLWGEQHPALPTWSWNTQTPAGAGGEAGPQAAAHQWPYVPSSRPGLSLALLPHSPYSGL